MSFILDALRKADEARHSRTPSALGRLRVPRLPSDRARGPWVLGGSVLLALNAGLAAYTLWPGDTGVTAPRDVRAASGSADVETARPADVDPAPRASVPGAPPNPPPPAA